MSQPESLGCTDKCVIKKITFLIIKIIKAILYQPNLKALVALTSVVEDPVAAGRVLVASVGAGAEVKL